MKYRTILNKKHNVIHHVLAGISVESVYIGTIIVLFALIPGGFIYASYTPPSVENLKRDDVYTRSLPPNATLMYKVWRDLETYEVM